VWRAPGWLGEEYAVHKDGGLGEYAKQLGKLGERYAEYLGGLVSMQLTKNGFVRIMQSTKDGWVSMQST
jgi:hypothetical protein